MAEVIRKLKAAGFVQIRSGKGSHLLLKHRATGKEVWVAGHTKKDAVDSARASCARQVFNDHALTDRARDRRDGAVSAYVPGLPVYAAADTHAKAERAIRGLLEAYLQEHPSSKPAARVRVARCSAARAGRVEIVGVGAKRTAAKARASRANGRLGGRPRKVVGTSTSRKKP